MAWTAPMTAVANSAFTAAQFNTYVRDNLNCTAPALATAAGQIFVSTGVNSIAARTPASAGVATDESTNSATYTDLATSGPAVTCTTGTTALVIVTARLRNDSAVPSYVSHAVSGASSLSADDVNALAADTAAGGYVRASSMTYRTDLVAGSNVFTLKYRAQTGSTGNFANRRVTVIPL